MTYFYKIKDIAKVRGGKRLPKGFLVQDEKTGHPYIRVSDMDANGIKTINIKYVPKDAFKKIEKYTISSEDIYLSNAGTIGLIGKIPLHLSGANLTENSAKITELDTNLINQDFLIFFLRSRSGQSQISARIGGSTQPKLALYKIETIEIPKVPIQLQNQAASIICVYDDLINANQNRINTLEEMALRTYKEWFINFKFPNYEKTSMVDYPPGYEKIPEGWKIEKLGEKIELIYGKALKEENRIPGSISVCGSGGIVGTHTEKQADGPGIIVGRKGNAGAVYWVDNDFFVIDTAFYVKTKMSIIFTYYLLKSKNFVTGDSTVPGLNREQTYGSLVLIPTEELINEFSDTVKTIRKFIEKTQKEIETLKITRDLLVSQLITGKKELK